MSTGFTPTVSENHGWSRIQMNLDVSISMQAGTVFHSFEESSGSRPTKQQGNQHRSLIYDP
jgi:hypothetical protein